MQKVNQFLDEKEYDKVNELLKNKNNDLSFQFTDTMDILEVFDKLSMRVLFYKQKKYE